MNRRSFLKAAIGAPFVALGVNEATAMTAIQNVKSVQEDTYVIPGQEINLSEFFNGTYDGDFGEKGSFSIDWSDTLSRYIVTFTVIDLPEWCSLEKYEHYYHVTEQDIDDAYVNHHSPRVGMALYASELMMKAIGNYSKRIEGIFWQHAEHEVREGRTVRIPFLEDENVVKVMPLAKTRDDDELMVIVRQSGGGSAYKIINIGMVEGDYNFARFLEERTVMAAFECRSLLFHGRQGEAVMSHGVTA